MTTSLDRRFGSQQLGQRERWAMLAILLATIAGAFLAVGPLLASLLVVAGAFLLTLLRFPDLGTSVVLFLVYSNIVVVGVKYHNVPGLLGAAVGLLLFVPLATHLLIRLEPIVLPRPFAWMVFLVGVKIVGSLLARSPELSIDDSVNFLLEGFVLYVALANVVRTKRSLRISLLTLLAAGCVMAAVPLFQQATGDFENDYGGFGIVSGGKGFRTGEDSYEGEVRQRRLAGPIGEQNRYAQVLLVLVPIGLIGFQRVNSRTLRRLALFGGGIAAAGATVAFSRGGAVGFAAMVALGFFLRYLGRRELVAMAVGCLLILMAAPQYVGRMFTLDAAIQVLVEGRSAAGTVDDGAITGRATEMGAAFLVFLDHPLLGVGPGMFRYYSAEYGERIGLRQLEGNRQAHSLLPDIAAEHGIAGLIGYIMVIGWTLVELHRVRIRWLEEDPELAIMASGLFLAVVTYLAVGMFMHRAYIRYFWILMGLAAAACNIGSAKRLRGVNAEPVESLTE